MGLVFEDLIRRFNEAANETAGDHFTLREVIQLMVNLLLEPDTDVLTQAGVIVTICDPACGTGGMLAEAQNWIRAHNEQATVKVYGQDYNPRSYAVAASDLLIKGQRDSRVELGNTLIDDRFADMGCFDYLLANPPFGVDWKAEKKVIDRWPDFPRLQRQAAQDQRWRLALPAAHDQQVCRLRARQQGPARFARGGRLQRLAAIYRRRRQRRERDPALDHRARHARSHRRPARADVLQHRHRHLHLGGQ